MSPPPSPADDRQPVAVASGRRQTLEAFAANRLALAGLAVLALFVAAGVLGLAGLAPTPYDPNGQLGFAEHRLQPPSLAHPFGTDELSRDVLSRVIGGAPVALRVAVTAVAIALGAGTLLGLVAGYYGRGVDAAVMRSMDVLLAFPAVLLAIALVAVWGPGLTNTAIGIGVVFVPIFARLVRGSVLSVREQTYVRAARSLGARDTRILRAHVLPNVVAPVIVQTSLSLAFAIVLEAALSFIGLSVQPPDPSWGRMLFEARGFVEQAWWMSVFPGLAIFVVVLSLNVVGDALRDALDPQQRSAIQAHDAGGGP